MNSVDIYKSLLKELDKYESPTFTIGDFNYFINSARLEYVHNNLPKHDILQKDADDLRYLRSFPTNISLTGKKGNLPVNYLHIESVYIDVEIQNEKCETKLYKRQYPKKYEAGRKGYILDNSFLKPSKKHSYYELVGGYIVIENGDAVIKNDECIIEYLKKPIKLFLDPNRTGADVVTKVKVTDVNSELPDYVDLEIIKVCKRIFLENIESGRYMSSLGEESRRVE